MALDRGPSQQPEQQHGPDRPIEPSERRRIERALYESEKQLIQSISVQVEHLMRSGDPKVAALILELDKTVREISERLDKTAF